MAQPSAQMRNRRLRRLLGSVACIAALGTLNGPALADFPAASVPPAWTDGSLFAAKGFKTGKVSFDPATRSLTLGDIAFQRNDISIAIKSLVIVDPGIAPDGTLTAASEDLAGLSVQGTWQPAAGSPASSFSFALDSMHANGLRFVPPSLPAVSALPSAWISALAPAVNGLQVNSLAWKGATLKFQVPGPAGQNVAESIASGGFSGLHGGKAEHSWYENLAAHVTTNVPGPAGGPAAAPVSMDETVAAASAENTDLGMMLALLDPAQQDMGDRDWHTLLSRLSVTGISAASQQMSLHIETITEDGFAMRRTGTGLVSIADEIARRVLAGNNEPKPEEAVAWLRALAGSFRLGGVAVTGLSVKGPETAPPAGDGTAAAPLPDDISVQLGRYSFGGIDGTGIDGIMLEGLKVAARDGTGATVGRFRIGRIDFGDLSAMVRLAKAEKATVPQPAVQGNGDQTPAQPPQALSAEEMRTLALAAAPRVSWIGLSDVSANAPASDGTLQAVSLGQASISMGRFLGGLPRFMDISVDDLHVPAALAATPQLEEAGIKDIDGSFGLAAVWDTDKSTFSIDRLWTAQKDFGTVSASALAENVPLSLLSAGDALQAELQKARLVSARVAVGNLGGVQAVLESAAKAQHTTPETLKSTMLAGLPLMMLVLGNPEVQKNFAAEINAFAKDPKSLLLTLAPLAPISFADLSSLAQDQPGAALKAANPVLKANE